MSFFKRIFGTKEPKVEETVESKILTDIREDSKSINLDESFNFITDTSTLCIFDIENLKYKLDDPHLDWWTIPEDEVLELNKGNLIIAALPADGKYKVCLETDFSSNFAHHVSANLSCKSGEVFLGDGAHITGDGMEPHNWGSHLSGRFLNLEPGNYKLDLYFFEDYKIAVTFCKNTDVKFNDFITPLQLRD